MLNKIFLLILLGVVLPIVWHINIDYTAPSTGFMTFYKPWDISAAYLCLGLEFLIFIFIGIVAIILCSDRRKRRLNIVMVRNFYIESNANLNDIDADEESVDPQYEYNANEADEFDDDEDDELFEFGLGISLNDSDDPYDDPIFAGPDDEIDETRFQNMLRRIDNVLNNHADHLNPRDRQYLMSIKFVLQTDHDAATKSYLVELLIEELSLEHPQVNMEYLGIEPPVAA